MDDVPIWGLDKLENHLDQVAGALDTPLEDKLFDDVELQLTGKPRFLFFFSGIVIESGLSNCSCCQSGLESVCTCPYC
jgi:hypothetical protein